MRQRSQSSGTADPYWPLAGTSHIDICQYKVTGSFEERPGLHTIVARCIWIKMSSICGRHVIAELASAEQTCQVIVITHQLRDEDNRHRVIVVTLPCLSSTSSRDSCLKQRQGTSTPCCTGTYQGGVGVVFTALQCRYDGITVDISYECSRTAAC